MLSYVKKCGEKDYTISFEPNLPTRHVFAKIHFRIFHIVCIFGSAGRAEPFNPPTPSLDGGARRAR